METHICNNIGKCNQFGLCYHGQEHQPRATKESEDKVKLYATHFRNINSELCSLKKHRCSISNFENTKCVWVKHLD